MSFDLVFPLLENEGVISNDEGGGYDTHQFSPLAQTCGQSSELHLNLREDQGAFKVFSRGGAILQRITYQGKVKCDPNN